MKRLNVYLIRLKEVCIRLDKTCKRLAIQFIRLKEITIRLTFKTNV